MSHGATATRSSDAWRDGAQELISGKVGAMSSENVENLTSNDNPGTDANKLLIIKTFQNVFQKLGVQGESLGPRQFPSHQALWIFFLEFLHVANSAPQQGRGSFPTCSVLLDIESIQKVFTSVQNQIQTLQEEELYGLTE